MEGIQILFFLNAAVGGKDGTIAFEYILIDVKVDEIMLSPRS